MTMFGSSLAAAVLAALAGTAATHPVVDTEFRKLSGHQIRAAILERDITDEFHWSEHYRRDGVLEIDYNGRRVLGRWKIQQDELCRSRDGGANYDCAEVWVSGGDLRLGKGGVPGPFTVKIRPHRKS